LEYWIENILLSDTPIISPTDTTVSN
jgi:hypothetical protein